MSQEMTKTDTAGRQVGVMFEEVKEITWMMYILTGDQISLRAWLSKIEAPSAILDKFPAAQKPLDLLVGLGMAASEVC